MSPPIIFRPLGHHTLKPVPVERVPELIRNLRSFLTAPRLADAIASYKVRSQQDNDIRVIRMRENQSLIEGFVQFDKVTFQGRRKLKRLTPEIANLAHIAGMAELIIPSLDAESRAQHIECLLCLNGKLPPLLLEWRSAVTIARNRGARLSWQPSKGKTAPEFVAIVDGIEFEVECKRPTMMVTQRLGDAEADELADAIMRCARSRGFQGRMTLEVSNNAITSSGGLRNDLATALLDHIKSGPVDVKLPNGAHLSGVLQPQTNQLFPCDLWLVEVRRFQQKLHNARAYANGKADGDFVSNAVTLMLTAPTKTPGDLSKDLWEKKFKKAASQCTGERGAIIVFEWESVEDPTIFRDAQIFQDMAASTFTEFPHIGRIVMCCDNQPEFDQGLIHFDPKVYTVENRQASFPGMTRFMRIEAPL